MSNAYENQVIEMESARNTVLDGYFKARPHLTRTFDQERIFEAGFERAWQVMQVRVAELESQVAAQRKRKEHERRQKESEREKRRTLEAENAELREAGDAMRQELHYFIVSHGHPHDTAPLIVMARWDNIRQRADDEGEA